MRVTTTKILWNLGLLLCIVLSVNVPSISSQATININLPEIPYTVAEGSFANVSICRSPSEEDTSLEVSTGNGTAFSGTDFLGISQMVTIPAGTMCISQFISIYPDFDMTEEDEFFLLTVRTTQPQIAAINIKDGRPIGTADEVDPVVTCTADVTKLTSVGSGGVMVQFTEPTATDDSGSVAVLWASHRPGQYFNTGSTPVTYTFIDPSGNKGSCEFQVIVIEVSVTNMAPQTPVCPNPSVTFTAQPGTDEAVANYGNIICTDNEQGSITAVCSTASGTSLQVGTHTVFCTCTDSGGLTSSCSFAVIVQVSTTNMAPQTPVCPNPSVTFPAQPGTNEAVANYGNIICIDNEQGSITAVCNPASGSSLPVGAHSVSCTCTDSGGLTSSCSFAVIVQVPVTNTAPQTPVCPTPTVTLTAQPPTNTAEANYETITCADNEDVSITAVCDIPSGTSLPVGAHSVSCTCTDSGGLTSDCSFVVIVQVSTTNMAPQTPVCPNPSVTFPAQPGTNEAVANYGNIICTDNEQGSITAVCNPASGSSLPVGARSVSCTCTDSGGLTSSCSFVVIVQGSSNNNPVISSCPSVESITVTSVGTSHKQLQFALPTCNDAEDGVRVVSCTPSSGSIVLNEVNSITCTCADTQQQSDSCSVSLSDLGTTAMTRSSTATPAPELGTTPSTTSTTPDLPKIANLRLISRTGSSLTLRWTITDSGSDTLTCRANYRAEGSLESEVINCSGSETCWLPGLSSYTFYSATIECRNKAGYSNPVTASERTASSAPSAPRNPTVENNSENCVVRWEDSEFPNGPGLYYEVTQIIRDASTDKLDESPGPVRVDSDTKHEFQKADMKMNSEYTSQICANNADHEGDCVTTIEPCVTNPGAPDSIPMIEPPDQENDITSTSVILNVPEVDNRNGPISCYEFVVVKRTVGQSGDGSPDDVQPKDVKNEPENDLPYRSVVLNHAEYIGKDTVTIGSDANTITRCRLEVSNSRRQKRSNMVDAADLIATNAPLEEGTNYHIFMRSYSETSGGMFQYTSSDYVSITTTGGGSSTDPVVFLVFLILPIIAVSVALLVVWFRKIRKKEDRSRGLDGVTYANEGFAQSSSSVRGKSKDRDMLSYENVANPKRKDNLSYEHVGNPIPMKNPVFQSGHPSTHTKKQPKKITSSTGYEETSFNELQKGSKELDTSYEGVIYEEMPEDSNNYDQAVYVTDKAPLPVKVSELPGYVNKKKYQKNGLEREFKLLPQGQHHPWTIATKAGNRRMNYIPNVLPYDHSRVKLTKMPGARTSDYFNANFIMDQHNRHSFIAAQGPYDNTVQEFLRLIWQEKVSIVIMVTPVEESGKKLCSEYWPRKVSGKSSFGNMRVTLASEEHYPDYSIRELMIHPEDKSSANVLQFHFPSWPYMGVPRKPTTVIRFIRYIKEALQERHFPVLVHCSDGSGATGTLIAAFCLMDELEADDEICIYEFVKKMRKNRVNMVQTKGQYTFLYDILLQAYLMPHSELSAKELKNMTIRKYSFSKEFQALKNPKYNVTAQSGASPENQGKNRSESLIPLDVHRPTLKCSSLTGGNNYINACFVDGYRDKNAFVMTQSPLPTTVEDFWRLVIDLQCSTIVMLNETDSSDSKSCVCYWPSGGNVQYGNILVTCVSTRDEYTYVHRQFNVTHQNQKTVVTVDHFQLQKSPQKNISIWRDFIRSLPVEVGAGPTIVHCVDGCGHSGVLVTVLNELQRLRQKQVVNVFETVQELRDNNPHAMQALELYTLCYEILQELTYQTQQ